MSNDHSKTITSLAILKINYDNGNDYIDNFVPFILNLVAKNKYTTFEVSLLKKDFEKEYGLVIPSAPLTVILKRAVKKGYLKRGNNQFSPILNKIVDCDFSSTSQEQERKLGSVVQKFISFVKTNYNVENSSTIAEAYLLDFLKNDDLRTVFNAQTAPSIFAGLSASSSLGNQSRYFVAKFIENVCKNDQLTFGFLSDLAMGQILAHTILNPNIQDYQGRFKGQAFYLDVAFLFGLLGIDGYEAKDLCQEIADTLKENEATLFVFRHTFDEFMTMMETDLRSLEQIDTSTVNLRKISRSLKSFILRGASPSDVLRIISTAELNLQKFGISVIDAPDWEKTKKHQASESKLRLAIIKAYRDENPSFDARSKSFTLQKDIDSISAIQRLRKSTHPVSLSVAQHTMITGNPALAAATNSFVNRGFSFAIPPCLHHLFIGTLLFIETPTRATRINEKKLIADAYAAMRPSDELIKKYWMVVDQLSKAGSITSEEYILLKSSVVARNMLQEKTQGLVNKVDRDLAQKILLDIDSKAKLEAQKELLVEKASHEKTQRDLQQTNASLKTIKNRMVILVKSIAYIFSWTIYIAIMIMLGAGIILRISNVIVQVFLGLLTLAGFAADLKLLKIRGKFQGLIEDFLKNILP